MCGIVGNVFASGDRAPDVQILERMAHRMRHRGPDDQGFVVAGPGALGMQRLKVIDLEGGHQPMTGESGQVWVVANCEIYNYRDLTAQLEARGHRFTTRSDTEVIVHGWEEWSLGVLSRLEGMFAIAVWDASTRTLMLARDRVGIKPLYYAALSDQLVFASELKALLEHPAIDRTLAAAGLSLYLAHEYVPAPHAILRQVRKLPAGHWLTSTNGHVKVEPYWDALPEHHRSVDRVAAARSLRESLDTVIREHLTSDVPVGVFLSGGIDSGTVAALAARHVAAPLKTFSVGFADRSFDESAEARRVARALGTDHHEETLSPAASLELVERLPDLIDEPLGDASFLPTYLLSRFARKSVTVALSGDGGDELFAGYPTYHAHRLARMWAQLPGFVRDRMLRPLVERLPVSYDNLSFDFRLKRFVAAGALDDVERHATWMGSFTPAEQRELLTSDMLARMEPGPSYQAFHEIAVPAADATPLSRLLYLDLKTYLGEGVLAKVDRASMACSLEVRVPLLDRRIVELATSLPDALKLGTFTTKRVLRAVARDLLPRDIAARPKKGFGVPLGRWFRRELANLLADVLAPEALRRGGVFRPDRVERLIAEHQRGEHDHRKKLYTLLVFQLWSSAHRVT